MFAIPVPLPLSVSVLPSTRTWVSTIQKRSIKREVRRLSTNSWRSLLKEPWLVSRTDMTTTLITSSSTETVLVMPWEDKFFRKKSHSSEKPSMKPTILPRRNPISLSSLSIRESHRDSLLKMNMVICRTHPQAAWLMTRLLRIKIPMWNMISI